MSKLGPSNVPLPLSRWYGVGLLPGLSARALVAFSSASGSIGTCFVRFVIGSIDVESVKVDVSPSGVGSRSFRIWFGSPSPPGGRCGSSPGRFECSFAFASLELSTLCGFS